MYPGPHQELLSAHFQTSVFASLSAAAEPLELDDDDEDDEELPSDHNEAVGIWASDSSQYPLVEWSPDIEEWDNSSPCKDVEVPQSGSRNCAVV